MLFATSPVPLLDSSIRRAAILPRLSTWLLISALFAASSAVAQHPGAQLGQQQGIQGHGGSSLEFTEVTLAAGLTYEHGYVDGLTHEARMAVSGVAVGDYDRDGWLDLYVVSGDIGHNVLYRNMGDGTFQDRASFAGVAIEDSLGSGPGFFDYDGDGWLDLLIGGIEDTKPRLFRNLGDGTFEERTAWSNIEVAGNTVSTAFGDYDLDGDLDIVFSHWNIINATEDGHIWRNDGPLGFTEIKDVDAGITGYEVFDYSLAPSFVDYDQDGWPDILISSDFGTSKIYRNQGDGTFENITSPVISDENGMGSAFGDYDEDGDLDWFVSSIWDPDGVPAGHWGVTGNRLYRNRGDGTFEDATTESGVRIGYWGWAACFVDFDHDMDLDLFHVNGFPHVNAPEFHNDPSLFYLSNGDGTFTEVAVDVGIMDNAQGRGVVCFDYDRDGDVDIFIANNAGPPSLYRNDGVGLGNYLTVALEDDSSNSHGLGATVTAVAGGRSLMRHVFGGSSYVSQQPQEVYFGLGELDTVDEVRIEWPDGRVETRRDVPVNQRLVIATRRTLEIPTLGDFGLIALCGLLLIAGLGLIKRH